MHRKDKGIPLDQFFTKDEVVITLLKLINFNLYKRIIEPSAGLGTFSLNISNCEAYDIDPKHSSIIKMDFLNNNLITIPNETLIIGNPPFGKQASLALKFINISCNLADTIAFILPASFNKKSMQDKVSLTHYLYYNQSLPNDSFFYNNQSFNIPTVFQIWKKGSELRKIEKIPTCNYFKFVNKEDNPQFWFRRVGVYAGRFGTTDIDTKSIQSHYFLSSDNPKLILDTLNLLEFSHNNTVGPKSISKYELITEFLSKVIDKKI